MSRIPLPRTRPGLAALTALVLVAVLLPQSAAVRPALQAASAGPKTGIACTYGPTFTFTTKTGYIKLPDGATAFMWGYALGDGPFQHPGPVLCVNEGDTVTIVLHNTLPQDTSIAFPGQENVLADGIPAQPQFTGGSLTSLTNAAPANGGSVTYSFVATRPGTFLYESGTNPQIQVRMGLFGALIVRPSMGANFAYNRADSQFTPEEEFLVLLSEIDPYLNAAVKNSKSFNMSNYHPRYWLINGRGFPDSIADNFASWLPSQPYGALALIHPFNDDPGAGEAYHPYPGLTRFLNVGTEDYPFHPHGNNGLIIGRDGWPLEGAASEDLAFEKFAVNIGPGQTWDSLFKWHDAEDYSEATNPVPITNPNIQDLSIGMFYGGSPYLGSTEPMPPGVSTLNECGEFYIIAHNHALYQITSWGVNMTGPITYTRIDPPLPNNCPS
jgi:FtsP/CotA-like multicopper oxidase with cupredoxin domain